jgi:hypothetical protein
MVAITPAANQVGSAVIGLTVTDTNSGNATAFLPSTQRQVRRRSSSGPSSTLRTAILSFVGPQQLVGSGNRGDEHRRASGDHQKSIGAGLGFRYLW